MKNIAVIFAGGTGTRMGVRDVPKQFLEVEGKPIIIYTLEYFQRHKSIDEVYVVCIESWISYLKYQLDRYQIDKVKCVIAGGSTGLDSIYRGLKEAQKNCNDEDIVLIHDGVRPFISEDLISRNISDTIKYGNSITCTECNETFLMSHNGISVDDVPIRRESFTAQAPQAFRLGEIIEAHELTRKTNPDYEDIVDCCTLFEKLGKPTYMTKGVRGNTKITNPVDIYIFEAWLEFKKNGGEAKGTPDLTEYERERNKTE